MKICGIPVPVGPDSSSTSATSLTDAVKSGVTANVRVHAVEQGAKESVCGVAATGLELWDEKFPGKRFPEIDRCDACRDQLSRSGG